MNIKKANDIIEEVIGAVSRWPKIAREQGIPQSQITMIGKTHRLSLS
jgi:hypothetical protein